MLKTNNVVISNFLNEKENLNNFIKNKTIYLLLYIHQYKAEVANYIILKLRTANRTRAGHSSTTNCFYLSKITKTIQTEIIIEQKTYELITYTISLVGKLCHRQTVQYVQHE